MIPLTIMNSNSILCSKAFASEVLYLLENDVIKKYERSRAKKTYKSLLHLQCRKLIVTHVREQDITTENHAGKGNLHQTQYQL